MYTRAVHAESVSVGTCAYRVGWGEARCPGRPLGDLGSRAKLLWPKHPDQARRGGLAREGLGAASHSRPAPQDVVTCVGGMGALLPLLERVAAQPQEAEAGPAETHDLVGPELTSNHNIQGLPLPLGKSPGKCPACPG